MESLCIIGTGLAGTLLAHHAIERGINPLLIDAERIWRASDAPRVMMHPFPSRSFKLRPHLFDALHESVRLWTQWGAAVRGSVMPMQIVRPLIEGSKSARSLRRTWGPSSDAINASSVQFDWLSNSAVESRVGLRLPESCLEAVVYQPALSIALGSVISGVHQHLAERGVRRLHGMVRRLRRKGFWNIELDGGRCIETKRVVLAPGLGLRRWFPRMECYGVGGELLHHAVERAPNCLISSGGTYIAPDGPKQVIVGGTYWSFDDWSSVVRDDAEVSTDLLERAALLWPKGRFVGRGKLWRGARLMWMPDRLPLVGAVPGTDGVFVLGALGSKGTLWGPWSALMLARTLFDGDAVPDVIAATRAEDEQWFTPWIEA